MKNSIRLLVGTAVLVTAAVSTGCRFDGANSIPLPGNTIHHGAYTVRVQMKDVQNLVANSLVRADDVTVGTITSITVRDYTAELTIEIDNSVQLPATVDARLAQTSVLGAQYLDLIVPKGDLPGPRLRDGDVIPLAATSEYPATEDVLAALSLVLNGSGLEQIRTIMAELNDALGGREQAINQSFARLATFVEGLDSQRQNIVRAIDSLDSFATELAAQKDTLGKGIEAVQPALTVLNDQRTQLTSMLDSVGRFGEKAQQVMESSRDDLTADLHNLQPALTQLASAGSDLTGSLLVALTFPFPVTAADRAIEGDYVNLFLTLDLTVEGIQQKILGSIPLNRLAPMAGSLVNPLVAPTAPTTAGTAGSRGPR
ncbi:MCE family protein [Nocardia fluminea]|uniref:MCE family protein n=1 Tax=Nocardia fluminea TaxID=134984 RepID=UPI0038218BC7